MAEVTIVTGYFDLNRENWQGFERSSNRYLEYFEFWASLKNRLVVYSDANTCAQVLSIRRGRGLEDRTEIVVVDDYRTLAPNLYDEIKKAMDSPLTKDFRLKPKNPESWNADYNYIMLLKEWCLKDAAENHHVTDTLAWMDIGYNKGGEYYINSAEFNFLWDCDIDDKVNIFQLQPMDDTPIFEVVRNMSTYVQGGFFLLPKKRCTELWQEMCNSMHILACCGLADDDQTVMLLTVRRCPQLFTLHPAAWYDGLRQCNCPQLSVHTANAPIKLNFIGKIAEIFVRNSTERRAKKEKRRQYNAYLQRTAETLEKLANTRKV